MTGGWQRSEPLYRCDSAIPDVPTLPPPSAVPLPFVRGGKRLCVVRKVVLRLFSAPTSRPPLPRGAVSEADWGVETLGDGVLLRIRSNTSYLLSLGFYRNDIAPCNVPTPPPPSAVPHGSWWLRLDCIEQSPGLFDL